MTEYGFAFPDISQEAYACRADIEDMVNVIADLSNLKHFAQSGSEIQSASEIRSALDRDESLLLYQMHLSDWTIFHERYIYSDFLYILRNDLQTLSQRIADSAVGFSLTDTGDYACYWHYKNGILTDKLEQLYEKARGYEERELTGEFIDYLFENEPDFIVDGYFHYISSSEGIDKIYPINQRERDKNSFALTQRFMESEKIFIFDPEDLSFPHTNWVILRADL